MKLYWKNKQMEDVDVLADSVLKAHITIDQEEAIIVDRDDDTPFAELAEKTEVVNGAKESFVITFSPERVVNGMDFLFLSPEEQEKVIKAINTFKETFLQEVISLAVQANDLVRAEVIRIIWKRFDCSGSVQSMSHNPMEEQELLSKIQKRRGENTKSGILSPIWKDIIELIIKYSIHLVLWEKSFRANDFVNKEQVDSYDNLELGDKRGEKGEYSSKYYLERYKMYHKKLNLDDEFLILRTQLLETKLYSQLELSEDVLMEEYRKPFFLRYEFKNKHKELNSIYVTMFGFHCLDALNKYYEMDEVSQGATLLNWHLVKVDIKSLQEKICEYLSLSIELVMMNLAKINLPLDVFKNEDYEEEKQQFFKEVNYFQFIIMPYIYGEKKPQEQQNDMLELFSGREKYSFLGGIEIFTNIHRNSHSNSAEYIEGKNRARNEYWKYRQKTLSKSYRAKNAAHFDLLNLEPKDRTIIDTFNQYVGKQKEVLNEGIRTLLIDVLDK